MKNWTVKDAVVTIKKGTDTADIKEITTHFPEFALAVARNDLVAIAAMMPEKMTLRRLQLSAAEAEAEDDGDEEEAEAPKTSGKGKAAESADDGDYSSMTKDQLIALCVEKGLKVAKHQKPKQYYIDALNAAGDGEEVPKKSGKVIPMKGKTSEAEDDAEDDEYAGKTAKELFNMCKERGIKVQPRQASRVYIEALKAADAEGDGDDEGWGDEDDAEEEAPKKPEKTSGKSGKKTTKKEEDDEEDWDI